MGNGGAGDPAGCNWEAWEVLLVDPCMARSLKEKCGCASQEDSAGVEDLYDRLRTIREGRRSPYRTASLPKSGCKYQQVAARECALSKDFDCHSSLLLMLLFLHAMALIGATGVHGREAQMSLMCLSGSPLYTVIAGILAARAVYMNATENGGVKYHKSDGQPMVDLDLEMERTMGPFVQPESMYIHDSDTVLSAASDTSGTALRTAEHMGDLAADVEFVALGNPSDVLNDQHAGAPGTWLACTYISSRYVCYLANNGYRTRNAAGRGRVLAGHVSREGYPLDQCDRQMPWLCGV